MYELIGSCGWQLAYEEADNLVPAVIGHVRQHIGVAKLGKAKRLGAEAFVELERAEVFQKRAVDEAEQGRPARCDDPGPLGEEPDHLGGYAPRFCWIEPVVGIEERPQFGLEVAFLDRVGAQRLPFLHPPGDASQHLQRVGRVQIDERAVIRQLGAPAVVPAVAEQVERLAVDLGA